MDWYQIATIIVSVLFGGQGIRSWMKTREAKKLGLPDTEDKARIQAELDALRAEIRTEDQREIAELRAARAADGEYIDALEAHIWQHKPPPPPRRRRIGKEN